MGKYSRRHSFLQYEIISPSINNNNVEFYTNNVDQFSTHFLSVANVSPQEENTQYAPYQNDIQPIQHRDVAMEGQLPPKVELPQNPVVYHNSPRVVKNRPMFKKNDKSPITKEFWMKVWQDILILNKKMAIKNKKITK